MGKHGGGIVAAGLVLVVAGCTSPATASPPSSPPLSPTRPASFTCVDDGVRAAGPCSRADYDAQQAEQATFSEAQQVYARLVAERNRLTHMGGATAATPELLAITSDPLTSEIVSQLKGQFESGRHVEGDLIGKGQRIERTATRPGSIFAMYVCEDGSATHATSASGQDLGKGRLADDVFFFARVDGHLKAVDSQGSVVTQCAH